MRPRRGLLYLPSNGAIYPELQPLHLKHLVVVDGRWVGLGDNNHWRRCVVYSVRCAVVVASIAAEGRGAVVSTIAAEGRGGGDEPGAGGGDEHCADVTLHVHRRAVPLALVALLVTLE